MSTYNETRVYTENFIDWWVSNTIHTTIENLWYSWDVWENQIYDLWLSI